MSVTLPIGMTDKLHIRPLSAMFDHDKAAVPAGHHRAMVTFELSTP